MVCMDYMITGLIDTKTAANILGISRSTLENMRYAGNGPAHIEIGRSVKYRPEAIDDSHAMNLHEIKENECIKNTYKLNKLGNY